MLLPTLKPQRATTKTVKAAITEWFAARGWKAFKFQKDVWQAIAQGQSGLLHATTGSGKTYAVWLGILMHFMAVTQLNRAQAAPKSRAKKSTRSTIDSAVDHAHAGAGR